MFLLWKAIMKYLAYLSESVSTLGPGDVEKDLTIVIVIWPKPES